MKRWMIVGIATLTLLTVAIMYFLQYKTQSRMQTNSANQGETMTNQEVIQTINITVGEQVLLVDLYDNATARDLVDLLPLEISVRDYGGQEKIGILPRSLNTGDAPASSSAQAGELGYYAPAQALVIYYQNVGKFSGIVPIGKINASAYQLRMLNSGVIKFDKRRNDESGNL